MQLAVGSVCSLAVENGPQKQKIVKHPFIGPCYNIGDANVVIILVCEY